MKSKNMPWKSDPFSLTQNLIVLASTISAGILEFMFRLRDGEIGGELTGKQIALHVGTSILAGVFFGFLAFWHCYIEGIVFWEAMVYIAIVAHFALYVRILIKALIKAKIKKAAGEE